MKQSVYTQVIEPYIGTPIHPLISLPSGDGNFESSLKNASKEDLEIALTIMTSFPDGNASRIAACTKRYKEVCYG